ncbi:3'(2'),5'-bisphosphate nucleotidase [Balneicella halophila]|uniref:3'(2'),5'-bisphosphate nucleotidase CysQ n=1 Tax=Balneicella halophila TaxID=1537566 RepID=A0A7L4UQA8_BALHA|nr:3'(2'),5'-bisphosphate nucleotidase CysQ [Balneicella halophila]PVX50782.1 3'(2'),5'-bisphosphate nucleotidase [Balneicella halophila]
MKSLMEIAIETAIVAGKRILEIYKEDDFQTELKEDDTPITRADKAAHEIITTELAKTAIPVISEEGKIKDYSERKEWQQFWLVDPLDGTKEFVKKNGEFTVNIALIENNKPTIGVIYVPVTGELYYGEVGEKAIKTQHKGTAEEIKLQLPLIKNRNDKCIVVGSRSFKDATTEQYIKEIPQEVEIVSRGSSLKLCMIAEGTADIYPRFVHLKEWDIAAGVAIVLASGGKVTNAETETKQEINFNSETLEAPFFIAKAK